jgi:hypothetical protein
MFKKLVVIGLTTALIGCGTSNRVLADASNIFTQQNPIDYNKIFNERTAIMGVIALLKPKTYVAPVNKTPTFYNHKQNDARLDNIISGFPHRAFNVTIASPTFPNRNRRTYMNIQFVVRWNQQYINDLYHAVAASSNPGGKGFAKFINTKHWTTPGYDVQLDMTSSNKLMRGLYRAGPQLQVVVGNRSLGCFDLPELSGLTQGSRMAKNKMVQPNGNGTIINGWLEIQSHIELEITQADAHNIHNARIHVVNINQCR